MDLHKTDMEFMERFEHFAFEEVVNEVGQQLPEENGIYGDSGDSDRLSEEFDCDPVYEATKM